MYHTLSVKQRGSSVLLDIAIGYIIQKSIWKKYSECFAWQQVEEHNSHTMAVTCKKLGVSGSKSCNNQLSKNYSLEKNKANIFNKSVISTFTHKGETDLQKKQMLKYF